MIPIEVEEKVIEILQQIEGKNSFINSISVVSGGSVNQTFCIGIQKQFYFLKINNRLAFPKMFDFEKDGLELLRLNSTCTIPNIFTVEHTKNYSFILMEYIESVANKSKSFWESFGRAIANLHQNSAKQFGFSNDNYIGSIKQINTKVERWSDFYFEQRLWYQAKLAYDRERLNATDLKSIEKLQDHLNEVFPIEKPALLHGDLWSGNFLCTTTQKPVLIDPAVYYGHREMDIAMTHLFGGFNKLFYDAYQEFFPLETGWESRIEVCNLYPLLVHVNLFGEAYANRLRSVMKNINFL